MRALRVVHQRAAAISERVRVAVASELDAGGIDAATRRVHRALDAEVLSVIERDAADAPACTAGCHYCCHVHVDATPAEVAGVARHLRATRSATELADLVALLASRRHVSAMTDDERWEAKIPCALLGGDGKCTVYEVRPLRCRAFHSSSVDVCRDAFAGVDVDPATVHALDRACEATESGYDRALASRGIACDPLALEPALLEALS